MTGWFAAAVSGRLMTGLQVALVCIALVQHVVVELPKILAAHVGPEEWIAYCLLLIVGLFAGGVLATGRPLTGPRRWTPMVLLVVAAVVITPEMPLDAHERGLHWFLGQSGWFALMLLLDLPLRVLGAVYLAEGTWYVGQVVLERGWSPSSIAQLSTVVAGVSGLQFAVACAGPLIRRIGREAQDTADAARRVAVEDAVSKQVHGDHERRYNERLRDTVPLLRALANGEIDPNAPDVRRRCAMEAARMRLLFAERDTVTDPLVHELRAAIDVAERRGVSVDLAVRGQPRELPSEIRRGLLEPVLAEVVSARTKARVTVLRLNDQIRVSAYGDHGDRTVERGVAEGVEVHEVTRDGWVWTEAVWKPKTSP